MSRADMPLLAAAELQSRAASAARENYWSEQELAHRLASQPEPRVCGWAGLNPHLPAGDEMPACRACTRWDRCSHGWKAPAL